MKNTTRGPATHNSPAALPTELLTVRHAADFAIVSQATVRRWLKDGLPHFRAGSQIRIAKEDLVNFLRKGGSGHHCENP
jgi:excisionase family DNA binding protein